MSWTLKKGSYRAKQSIARLVIKKMNFDEPFVISGSGSLKKLPGKIKADGINNVLVVTDKGLMSLGLLDCLFEELKEKKIQFTVYDGVQPNPTIDNIENAYNMYLNNNCEAIVAFGGGSSMDCAKVAGARANNPNQSVKAMRGLFKIKKPLPPFYAVPTTAGTGSETTIAAVVTDPNTHEKFAVSDKKIVPNVAVLDPDLTIGLPKHITSTTGMDALTHAVEAYIGTFGTPYTDENAEKAVKMIFDNLESVYEDGTNIKAREDMLLASYYAGNAFTRAFVGYVHAIAHNLGGMYGVPHGLANAVVLPYILEYFGESSHEKLAKLAIIGGLGSKGESKRVLAEKFIDKVKEMNKNMNIPRGIEELMEKDIPLISQRAMKEGNPDYPVPKIMSVKECEELMRKLLVIQKSKSEA